MYYHKLTDALEAQKKHGGTLWYDQNKSAYYLVQERYKE